MSKSWREQAATDAASSLLEHTGRGSKKVTITDKPFVYIAEPDNPLATCKGCFGKDDIKQVGMGNKMQGDKPRLVLHLCKFCRNAFGLEMVKNNANKLKAYTIESANVTYARNTTHCFHVIVPASEDPAITMKNFEMASKYASDEFNDDEYMNDIDPTDYDEHFSDMKDIKQTILHVLEGNNDDMFKYYCTKICGYTIEERKKPDFTYEW